jgi:glycosyltransferase involved in cell wall biosynthesis
MVNAKRNSESEDDEPGGDRCISFAHMNIWPEIFSEIRSIFTHKKKLSVSLIIPAYNEAPRIGKVIKQAQLVEEIEEIIVVDDGSKDGTDKVAEGLGVEVVKHHRNMGKGEALKTGIAHAKKDILLFLDADLANMTPEKTRALIRPILRNKADFVKASFGLVRGRVTEFAIKPIMKVLYPNEKFNQPISGQFAGRREFFENIEIVSDWGIDISILLDAIDNKERIVEVELGELRHKGRPTDEKAEMSKQVMETILKKAGHLCNEHGIVVFSDKTIFSSIFSKKVGRFLEILKGKKIRIVILSEKKVDKKYREFFDDVKIIKSDYSGKKIASIVKAVAKKNDVEMKEVVLAANKKNFDVVAGKVGTAYCFSNSNKKLQDKCEVVSSLAEILMYLK